MRVTLMTNARKLTPELASLLARMPPREPVEITAYGMCPESYAAVSRVAGAYDEFRRGLGLLDAGGVAVPGQGHAAPAHPAGDRGVRGVGGHSPSGA